MKERDIGFEMSGRLVNEHGFEQDHTWRGRFRKIVDAEHAAVVTFSSWREPGGGAGRGVPIFGVARSDINLLEDQLLDRKVKGQWRATIEERGKRSSSITTVRSVALHVLLRIGRTRTASRKLLIGLIRGSLGLLRTQRRYRGYGANLPSTTRRFRGFLVIKPKIRG